LYLPANSRLSSTRSASFIAGPALGGVLVQVLTAPIALLADAVSFLASALLIGRIPPTDADRETDHRGASSNTAETADGIDRGGRRVLEGLRFLAGHRYLRASLACTTTVNFFSLMASSLLVLFASRTLGLSAGVIGLAFGLGATGGLLGALMAPRLARRFGIGMVVIVGAVVYPAAYAIPALAGGPTALAVGVLAVAEFIGSFGVMLFDVNLNSLQAMLIPDSMRSRVAGAFSTVNYGARPLGALTGGLLGTTIGLRPTLVLAAVGGAASCLWLWHSPIRRVHDLTTDPLLHPVARASVGESRAARRAGYSPATAPMSTAAKTPPTSAGTGSTSGQSR
jgi:Na+/melibiose symporter-like transporter